MHEFKEGILGTSALLAAVLYSGLVWIGGREESALGVPGRIWGRYLAPAVFTGCVCLLAVSAGHFSWWMVLSEPAYRGSHSLGYGGDTLWQKIFRRSMWSLARTAASITFALPAGAWTLFGLQLVIGLCASLALGIRNPLKAPQEEALNNFLSVALVPFMVL